MTADTDSVLEAVVLAALFTAQVDEVMRQTGRVLVGHFPADPERVAGHIADLNIMGCGEQLHLSHRLQEHNRQTETLQPVSGKKKTSSDLRWNSINL